MQGRTVILVSHHVQLCAPGANYVVALDNGRVLFEGNREAFQSSGIIRTLVQTSDGDAGDAKDDAKEEETIEDLVIKELDPNSESSSTITTILDTKAEKKAPRKLVEEEKRAVGRIGREVWLTYVKACGNGWYWTLFIAILVVASVSPVFENGWLRYANQVNVIFFADTLVKVLVRCSR